MSTYRTIKVETDPTPQGSGWTYNLEDLEKFIAECRAAGMRDRDRFIRANNVGQLIAQFNVKLNDPAD